MGTVGLRVRLISKILEDPSEALELCRHNFGHHVVQLVLERGHPRQGTRGARGEMDGDHRIAEIYYYRTIHMHVSHSF